MGSRMQPTTSQIRSIICVCVYVCVCVCEIEGVCVCVCVCVCEIKALSVRVTSPCDVVSPNHVLLLLIFPLARGSTIYRQGIIIDVDISTRQRQYNIYGLGVLALLSPSAAAD